MMGPVALQRSVDARGFAVMTQDKSSRSVHITN